MPWYTLDEAVALAATCDGIAVKVDKLKLAKWFKHLFDITFGKVKVERANVKSGHKKLACHE
jgi:hypothetical protein